MLEIKNIFKTYQTKKGIKTEALKDVNLKFNNRGLVFVIGKSGSGKSTFLNVVGGLDNYNSGEIIIDGKSSIDFKTKDFDYYRNTYIGFVFQEFNLLDNFTVLKNIELSLELQGKKNLDNKIENLLEKLEINDLLSRKPNELSGGQKQRVSIARALIKDPKIILADEPTGSLDITSGEQVFELLKEISKERLVIIVSHDEDAARKYADRVIRFKDGVVTDDIYRDSNFLTGTNDEFKVVKSKLPFKDSLRIALSNLNHKKLRLVLTILLISLSLTFFGVSLSMANFNASKSHSKLMVESKEKQVIIRHNLNSDDYDYIYEYLPFNDDDLLKIDNVNKYYKSYKLFKDGKAITLSLDANEDFNNLEVYYMSYNFVPEFIEIDDINSILKENIIGKTPSNTNEIVISNYFADHLIKFGIKQNEKDELGINKVYHPKDYNEIINGKSLYLENIGIVNIVGIIDYDIEKYIFLKDKTYDKLTKEEMEKYVDFSNFINYYKEKIYVKKGFVESLNLEDNLTSNEDLYMLIKSDNKSVFTNGKYINDSISIYDGTTSKSINFMNSDEIIITLDYLSKINDSFYEGLKSNTTNTKKSIEDYLKKYNDKNSIIGSTVEITVNNKSKGNNYKIIGIYYEDYFENNTNNDKDDYMVTTYFAKDSLGDSVRNSSEVIGLYTNYNSYQEFYKFFNKYPINKEKYISQTLYSDGVLSSLMLINFLLKPALITSLVFFIFGSLLLINFIITSIVYRKKEIGILRSIGANNHDIFKIFLLEGIAIILVAIIIAVSLTLFVNGLINSIFVANDIVIKPFMFGIKELLILIVSSLILTFISYLIPIKKITSMKPIDAILNK